MPNDDPAECCEAGRAGSEGFTGGVMIVCAGDGDRAVLGGRIDGAGVDWCLPSADF